MSENKLNVLVCSTGSVATIKLPEIIGLLKIKLKEFNVNIRICLTSKAKYFCSADFLSGDEKIFTDEDEWTAWKGRGDPVIHIDLVKWADILLIAPLDANTLGKIASGICDNMLTCIVRAWDIEKPLIFCPAMNTKMWNHPITATQISTLKTWGYHEIPCISKTLMCGDTGLGAMAEPETITDFVTNLYKSKK